MFEAILGDASAVNFELKTYIETTSGRRLAVPVAFQLNPKAIGPHCNNLRPPGAPSVISQRAVCTVYMRGDVIVAGGCSD